MSSFRRWTQAGMGLFLGLAACSTASARSEDAPTTTTTAVAESGSPLLGGGTPTSDERALDGTVKERLDAGPYVYLRVVDEIGHDAWVATLATSAAVGSSVRVRAFVARDDFHSKRLDRTFARLLMGVVTER